MKRKVGVYLILPHHVGHGFLQSVKSQLKHGKDLSDVTDGLSIGPFIGKNWLDSERRGKDLGNKSQPLITGSSRPLFHLDGAAGCHEFVVAELGSGNGIFHPIDGPRLSGPSQKCGECVKVCPVGSLTFKDKNFQSQMASK